MEFHTNAFLKITKTNKQTNKTNRKTKAPLSCIWKLLDLDLAQNEELLFIIYTFALSTHFLEFTETVCLKYRPSLVLLTDRINVKIKRFTLN